MSVSVPATKTSAPAVSDYLVREHASVSDERAAIAAERDRLAQARELPSIEPGVKPASYQMGIRGLLVAARLRDEAAIIRDLAANRRDVEANSAADASGAGGLAMLLGRERARHDRAASRADRMASASDRIRLSQRTVPAVMAR